MHPLVASSYGLSLLKTICFALAGLVCFSHCLHSVHGIELITDTMVLLTNPIETATGATGAPAGCLPTVCVLNPTGTVTTLAGSGTAAFLDGPGATADFDSPIGLASDGTTLYVADCNNNRVRKITIATGVVSTLAGSGVAGSFDGTGVTAQFNCPSGLTMDAANLYLADAGNDLIRIIVKSTGVVTTLTGQGGSGFLDGTIGSAKFLVPSGITINGTDLYVADAGNHRVRKIAIGTGIVSTIAGSGAASFLDATGTTAQFWLPYGITTDGTNLYVADSGNARIRRIVLSSGVVSTLAGSAIGFLDGTGPVAQFNNPYGVSTDGINVYVADFTNNRIRKLVISTGLVSTLAGSGVAAFMDGTGITTEFNGPADVLIEGSTVYVADQNNHRIRRIQ